MVVYIHAGIKRRLHISGLGEHLMKIHRHTMWKVTHYTTHIKKQNIEQHSVMNPAAGM